MRNHKFGPHHIDFSFLQQLPFLFFLHDVTNSPIARSYVRRKSQVVPKIQGAAGSGASRRPKFIFFFIFLFLGGWGRHLPQALTRWLWWPWSPATSLLIFLFIHFLNFKWRHLPSDCQVFFWFPCGVDSSVDVLRFPVRTPSQTPTYRILETVDGLVAVHRPNLQRNEMMAR